ncbi:MAG: hypothetical protein HUK08_01005 [Bacteroidaceae bacterium]|nr:hypothetical protein [Bacteroidaceae bacterium]
MNILGHIEDKAAKEKAYVHLFKSQMLSVSITLNIMPDSTNALFDAIREKALEAEKNDRVAGAIYNLALYKGAETFVITNKEEYKQKAFADKSLLAATKTAGWKDIITLGKSSEIYDNDMLSLMGYCVQDYKMLYDYYKSVGNRRACALLSVQLPFKEEYIREYYDLPEGAYIAEKHLKNRSANYRRYNEEEYKLLKEYQRNWAGTDQQAIFNNIEKSILQGELTCMSSKSILLPNKPYKLQVTVRNIDKAKATIIPLNVYGRNISEKRDNDFFKKILSSYATKDGADGYKGQRVVEKTFTPPTNFQEYRDSIIIPALPVGVYYMKIEASTNTAPELEINKKATHLYEEDIIYVTGLRIIQLGLPEYKSRRMVVDAITGHEVKDATLQSKQHRDSEWTAYTKQDNAMPYVTLYGSTFRSHNAPAEKTIANLYIDRGIYRPGQTVHVAGILHKTLDGLNTEVIAGKEITIRMRNANHQVVAEKKVQTDDYGTISADMTIPQGQLTGRWYITCDNAIESRYFNVEEYKRPTFEVSISEYDKEYKFGDTIKVKGYAKTYSGVPVSNCKVSYNVSRHFPFWCWWNEDRYGETIASDSAMTDNDGMFELSVPLVLPDNIEKDSKYLIYNYTVLATVTNLSGESHDESYTISCTNRSAIIAVNISKKILKEQDCNLMVKVVNNRGKDITDAKYTLQIDNKGKKYTSASEAKAAISKLASGKHSIKAVLTSPVKEVEDAVCDSTEFTVFSLDDAVPVKETPDWFYATASQFKDKEDVVTLQFGSSRKDVDIFYDVFEGKKLKESATLHCSNSLIRKDFRHTAEGNKSLLITLAWVKDDVLYTHSHQITCPMPDKTLKPVWKTFRNKLLPGQQEEWTVSVPNREQVLMTAVLYDKSLDALAATSWSTNLGLYPNSLSTTWRINNNSYMSINLIQIYVRQNIAPLEFSTFSIAPLMYDPMWHFATNGPNILFKKYSAPMMMASSASRNTGERKVYAKAMDFESDNIASDAVEEAAEIPSPDLNSGKVVESGGKGQEAQMRTDFSETGFFFPQLVSDNDNQIALKFTLPETTTTWKFRGLAHDRQMNYGLLEDEIIAQKQLMISPNMPRFIRKGDKMVLSSTITNLSDKKLNTVAKLELLNPESEKTVCCMSQDICLDSGCTAPVDFLITSSEAELAEPLYIVRISVVADGMSDGEQHYLAVIDNEEPVISTKAITMVKPGKETVNTAELFPTDAKDKRLTVEWTENPTWLLLETLPFMADADQTTAYSQAAAYYANALGEHLLQSLPSIPSYLSIPAAQNPGNAVAPPSPLEKNQELKTLLLQETPWVMDAQGETERMNALRNFFDKNRLTYTQGSLLKKLSATQHSDGGWGWCPGMRTSYHITSEICELFTRLNNMTDKKADASMLSKAMNCLKKKAHEEILEMKKAEKEGSNIYIHDTYALQYVYLNALSNSPLSADARKDADFLIKYLKKQERKNTLYMKAKLAIVLHYMGEKRLAEEYVRSIKEYSVYKETEGRYFDSPRAAYSWRNYRQPTQTMAIEAIKAVTPNDRQTIAEMQRWILMQKRTQMWDTPINTVNNVYAFMNQPSSTSGYTAPITASPNPGINTAPKGYSKKTYAGDDIQPAIVFEKDDDTVSWGAVYATYKQKSASISDYSEGLKVSREIISADGKPLANSSQTVGTKVIVRITITADRDYDFVQVTDKRAACLEPVSQLSAYHRNYYETPNDTHTCYFFDQLAKGTHTIETLYYIDRQGDYQSGTCTAQCAYAPEYYGRTGGTTISTTSR